MPKILRVNEIAELTGFNKCDIYRFANRQVNPLPLKCLRGKLKGAFAFEDELWEWFRSESVPWLERGEWSESR